MGLLQRILGQSKPQTRSLAWEELVPFIRKQQEASRKEQQRAVLGKMAELRHEITELRRSITELERQNPEKEEGNKRLRKIVQTTKTALVRQMKTLAAQLTPPQTDSVVEMYGFIRETEEWLDRERKTFGKNIAYSSTVMKEEVKALGESIRNMINILSETRKQVEGSSLLETREMEEEVATLEGLVREHQAMEERVSEKEREQESIRSGIRNAEQELEELKNSAEAEKLTELEQEMATLEAEKKEVMDAFRQVLAEVDKPLKRFYSYVTAGHYPMKAEERKLLEEYVQDPVSASRQDVKGEQLKQLLVQMRTLLEEGKLLVKDKQREKAFAGIEKLRQYDFYGNLFWKLNKREAEENEIRKQLRGSSLHQQISEAEQRIADYSARLEGEEKQADRQRVEVNNQREKIAVKKEELAEIASRISGMGITIRN